MENSRPYSHIIMVLKYKKIFVKSTNNKDLENLKNKIRYAVNTV